MSINGACEIRLLKDYMPLIKKDETMQKEKTDEEIMRKRVDVLREEIKIMSCRSMFDKKSAVREGLVASLIESIQGGLYQPVSEKIAAGIILEMLSAKTIA
jgi:anti-sigma28 factor (negative regulator of flagellin synthesis)